MVEFTTTILKFNEKGEKTGWTYIEIPADAAQQLKPGNKKSFRVQGMLDNYCITRIALLPMGDGDFIMPLNAMMRKGIGKRHGAILKVSLRLDNTPEMWDRDFLALIIADTDALRFFKTLPSSQRNYFSKWVNGAKTETTKAKRIAQSLNALSRNQNYGQMLRSFRKQI